MKDKQLYYDREAGMLWYVDEDGVSRFYKWIESASEEEYESAIIKQAPEDE